MIDTLPFDREKAKTEQFRQRGRAKVTKRTRYLVGRSKYMPHQGKKEMEKRCGKEA